MLDGRRRRALVRLGPDHRGVPRRAARRPRRQCRPLNGLHRRARRAGGLWVALAVNTNRVRIGDYAQGVLALAAGEPPVERVPGLALREKLDAVAGPYEAYRDPTPTVEATDGDLTIDLEYVDESIPAFPETLAADDYSFY